MSCSPNAYRWPAFLAHQCIYTRIGLLSWLAGYISIAGWVVAGCYQSWICYKSKDMSGFSIWFLIAWLLGDITNLVGCILTHQMLFQTILAANFVLADSFLFGQYLYYTYYYTRSEKDGADMDDRLFGSRRGGDDQSVQTRQQFYNSEDLNKNDVMTSTRSIETGSITSQSSNQNETTKNHLRHLHPRHSDAHTAHAHIPPITYRHTSPAYPVTITPAIILGISMLANPASAAPIAMDLASLGTLSTSTILATLQIAPTSSMLIIGRICSWLSTFLYIFSRLPQIYRNYIRRSTGSLSMLLFIAANVGNFSYCLSIASEYQAIQDHKMATAFLFEESPFLIAGIITLLTDSFLFWQFYHYTEFALVEGLPIEEMDETTPLKSVPTSNRYV